MTYPVFGLLAVVALAPLLLSLLRATRVRGRREADVALYRARLNELDRERDEGRITAAEHAAATAETGRHLIAAAATVETGAPKGRITPVVLAFLLVPAAGLALYLVAGSPGMPAAPFAEVQAERAKEAQLIAELRARLAGMDPHSERARTGWVLLAGAERARGNFGAAADAYKTALAARFDPETAFRAGTMVMAAQGEITDEARDLYRRALAAAPADAAWRPMAEQLLAQP